MRLDLDDIITKGEHWSSAIAKEVIKEFPNREIYTCAAGISPSGTVHFGNFRDVITSYLTAESLKKENVKSRCIFSWDNFDRFRKVPINVPEEFKKYVGMPLSKIPSPVTGFSSYAEYFQKPFEDAMSELGIDLEFKYQTEEYESGRYDDEIVFALKNREEIAKILLSFMTDKGKQEANIIDEEYIRDYYPISVYSRFSGKDFTKVISYDGDNSITYECKETGKTDTINIREDHIVKLAWKVDWPMRWKAEGVVFEPGGHDHASPGSSFDVSTQISEQIFNEKPPVFAEYKFVGIQGMGTKMSGSKGNAVSPLDLLEIYEPDLLKWIYSRKRPDQAFSLAFDTEIYRQYDEFDREFSTQSIPFKQAVALGQITQWNIQKVINLSKDLGENYSEESINLRLPRAKNWLLKYNSSEAIELLHEVNNDYVAKLDEESQNQILKLRQELEKEYNSIEELEKLVYSIPKDQNKSDKENGPAQKLFFKHLYNLLIGKDAGPRLSTFIWAVPRNKILDLLNIQK